MNNFLTKSRRSIGNSYTICSPLSLFALHADETNISIEYLESLNVDCPFIYFECQFHYIVNGYLFVYVRFMLSYTI